MIPKRKKYNKLPFRHQIVRDGTGNFMVTPSSVTQEMMDLVARKFVVRDDDVFLVTYPKSGTIWLRQIVHLLANNGEQGDKILDENIPYLEGAHKDRIDNPENFMAMLENIAGRRYLASHLPYALMPGVDGTCATYVYLARNPKDCAVSFYYFMLNLVGRENVGTWEEFLAWYLDGQVYYGLVFNHMLAWWQTSQQSDRILFVKYEDMQHDLAGVVSMIAECLHIPLRPALLETVMKQSAFAAMKANPKANMGWVSAHHLRKGITGDWRTHFSVEQNALFDARYREKWERTGLDSMYMRDLEF